MRSRLSHLATLAALAIISFGATAPEALPTWTATQVWRRDGTESGEPFAMPRELLAMPDGTLWMLDFEDQRIRRYDASGKELAGVGRKGSGPGEFRNANGMLLHPGGTVWVNDPRNARLTVLSANGRYVRQESVAPWGWRMRWEAWVDSATGRVADPIPLPSLPQGGVRGWRMITPGKTRRDSVTQPACASGRAPAMQRFEAKSKDGAMMGPYPFITGGGAVATARGTLWCADAGSTRVALIRIPRGDTVLTTSVDIAALPVTRAERDSVLRLLTAKLSTYAQSDFDPMRVRTSKPGIAALWVDYDGRLWVQHTRVHGATGTTFDVHTPRGAQVARVTIPGVLYHEGYIPVIARGNDAWAILTDDDGVPSIARFRLAVKR